MSLRFRAVRIQVLTAEGLCGATVDFPDGLTVIQAPNSSGKSTIAQALIYALGLEGMLSTNSNP